MNNQRRSLQKFNLQVATERKSFLPLRSRPTGIVGLGPTLPMPSVSDKNNQSALIVGSRVLVNGLKSGTLRYIGPVQFAQGVFCGVELDQPDGKHDGEVKDIRYFQCAANHGVFVPQDKVALAPRARASSSQRPISRLKPPTMTRSITISSAINKTEPSKSVQLPDIVPNSASQPVTPDESNDQESILSTEQPRGETIDIIEPKIEFQPIPIDETPETDFTDSVSLILHQLQQEQQIPRCSSSITISEEDSDDEDLDNESVMESNIDEQFDQTHHSSASSVFIPINSTKSIQTDLSFHSNDHISFTKLHLSTSINKKQPIVQPVKKNIERRSVVPATNNTKRPITRKPTIIPAKKATVLSLSHSLGNSLNSSQSDVTSVNKTPKQLSDTMQDKSQLIPLLSASSENQYDESHGILTARNQSLQTNNQQLKKYYQHLLNQFDLMHILNQYYLNQNEQIHQQHAHQLSQARTRNDRMQTSVEQLRLAHRNDLSSLHEQYQNEMKTIKNTSEQQFKEYQQKIDHFLHEKTDLESHCLLLQEKVDGFLTEMANSEHADVLLCHVETLEKDRTSLQTVLDIKYKEIAQLRTKLHEQEIKLSDEQALQKRMTMAENRVQDLEWSLREKQLTEKAAVIERDDLKERTAQLERDNCQLKFENETLRYRLHQPLAENQPIKLTSIPSRRKLIRHRAYSLALIKRIPNDNEHLTRSLSSLNCILHR